MSPSKGPMSGGSRVVIKGQGLEATGRDLVCSFGELVSAAAVGNDGAVACTSPASGLEGRVSFRLSDNAGQVASGPVTEFLYYVAPRIVSVVPSRGPLSGDSAVRVYGEGFLAEGLRCRFGSTLTDVRDSRWLSSTVAMCVVPAATGGR
eukprot:3859005-Rhodomonas_salina.1